MTSAARMQRGVRRSTQRTPQRGTRGGILGPDWGARFAAERARLQLHYCNLFKFWRACRDKRCRRHLRCCGDTSACLKRRIGEISRTAQFEARQAVLVATPHNAGPAERTVRQFMPCDVITPDPTQVAANLRKFEAAYGR
jgi:hypothetical protein